MLQFFGHQMYPWENLTMKKGATKIDQYWLPATFLQKKSAGKPLVIKPTVSQYFSQLTNFSVFFKYLNFPAKKKFWRENSNTA